MCFTVARGEGSFRGVDKVVSDEPDCFNLLQMIGVFGNEWNVVGLRGMPTAKT